MNTIALSEQIIKTVSDLSDCIYRQEAYLDEKTMMVSVFQTEEEKKTVYYVAVSENNTLCCLKNIREDLDKLSASNAFGELVKRIEGIFSDANVAAKVLMVVNEEDEDTNNNPLIVRLSGTQKALDEASCRKMICSEFADWMDYVKMVETKKLSQKEEARIKADYDRLMNGTLPGEIDPEKSNRNSSSMMAIVTLIATILGIIWKDIMVFQVIGMIAGGFAAYRCYSVDNKKGLVVCIICFIASAVFLYVGYKDMKVFMGNQAYKIK